MPSSTQPPTHINSLSLHDALPIFVAHRPDACGAPTVEWTRPVDVTQRSISAYLAVAPVAMANVSHSFRTAGTWPYVEGCSIPGNALPLSLSNQRPSPRASAESFKAPFLVRGTYSAPASRNASARASRPASVAHGEA